MNVNCRKLTNEREENRNRNWMRFLEHSLALAIVFKEASRNVIFIFLLNKKG
jgi:hypothetical protein